MRFRFDVGSERRWFAGAVKSYSKKRGHCIAYDNGQVGMQHLDDWSPSDFEILWESSVVLSAGTRVRLRWDVGSERRWFAGVVKSYSKKRGYCMAYDNGQVRTERLDTWSSSDFEVVAADCAEENVDGHCFGDFSGLLGDCAASPTLLELPRLISASFLRCASRVSAASFL